MTKLLFVWFLLLHVLGDYYLQTNELAETKRSSYAGWLKHSLIYGASFLLSLVAFPNLEILGAIVAIALIHALIDKLKPLWEQRLPLLAYFIDQGLHLATLWLAAYLIRERNWFDITWLPESFFDTVVPLVTAILVIAKPANHTIKHLLATFSPTDKLIEEDESLLDGGKVIGTLERVLVLLLLLADQWGAVGVVFAAKSIIRWKNISKDNTEYFLIGTLLSLIFVVAIFYVIFRL